MSDRLEKLKELEAKLYTAMRTADSRSLASIARQYRETLKDIAEIEGMTGGTDEISEILAERSADGKSGAVRPDRTGLS